MTATPAKTERNAAIRASRLAGASIKGIAREYGICVQRVKQLTVGLGIPPRSVGRPVLVDGVRYETVTAAATAAGITQSTGSKRAAAGRHGWRYLGLMLGLLAAACCGSADAHDLFANLHSPNGQLCCGDIDCKPVDECVLPDHHQGLMIEGTCTPIPPGTTLGMASPDGQAHACYGHTNGVPFVRCAILPGDV